MKNRRWLAGALLQGVVLGSLLFLAICKMLALASGVPAFRYEGF